jgi:hypothetical protein
LHNFQTDEIITAADSCLHFVAIGTNKGTLLVTDLEGNLIFRLPKFHKHDQRAAINSIFIHGSLIVTGGQDGSIINYDWRAGLREVYQATSIHGEEITWVGAAEGERYWVSSHGAVMKRVSALLGWTSRVLWRDVAGQSPAALFAAIWSGQPLPKSQSTIGDLYVVGKLVLFSTTQGVFVYDDSLQAIVVQFKCKDGAQRCRIYLNDQHFVIYSNKTIYICNRQFTDPFKLEIMRVLKTQEEILSLSIIDNYLEVMQVLPVEPNEVREEIKQRRQTRVTLRHNDSLQDLQWQNNVDDIPDNNINDYSDRAHNDENQNDFARNGSAEVKEPDINIDDTQPCHRMAICSYSLDDHQLNNDFFYIPLENFFQKHHLITSLACSTIDNPEAFNKLSVTMNVSPKRVVNPNHLLLVFQNEIISVMPFKTSEKVLWLVQHGLFQRALYLCKRSNRKKELIEVANQYAIHLWDEKKDPQRAVEVWAEHILPTSPPSVWSLFASKLKQSNRLELIEKFLPTVYNITNIDTINHVRSDDYAMTRRINSTAVNLLNRVWMSNIMVALFEYYLEKRRFKQTFKRVLFWPPIYPLDHVINAIQIHLKLEVESGIKPEDLDAIKPLDALAAQSHARPSPIDLQSPRSQISNLDEGLPRLYIDFPLNFDEHFDNYDSVMKFKTLSLNSEAQNVLPNMVSNLGVEIVSPLGNEFDFNSPSPNISLTMTSSEEDFKRLTAKSSAKDNELADDITRRVQNTEKMTPSKVFKDDQVEGNEEDNVRFLFLALFKLHELNGDTLSAAKVLVRMRNRFAAQYFSAMALWPYFISSEEKEVYIHSSSEDSNPDEESLGKSPQQKIESYNDRITLLSGSPMDFQSIQSHVPSNLSAEQKQLIVDMMDVDPHTTLTNLALSLRFTRQASQNELFKFVVNLDPAYARVLEELLKPQSD